MRLFLWLGLIAFLLFTAGTSFTVINSGERAVVRRFGRVLPESPGPGLHVGLPWGIDRVDREPIVQLRTINVGFNPKRVEEDQEITPQGQFLTGDHNLVNVQAEISYSVREEEVERYVLQKDRVDTVLAWLTESVLSEYIAGQNVDHLLLRGQQELRKRLLQELPERLRPYHLGIQIENANLKPLFPPEEVREEFEKVSQAETSIGTKVYQAEQESATRKRETESETYKLLRLAGADAASKRLEAESDANTFSTKLEQYRLILEQERELSEHPLARRDDPHLCTHGRNGPHRSAGPFPREGRAEPVPIAAAPEEITRTGRRFLAPWSPAGHGFGIRFLCWFFKFARLLSEKVRLNEAFAPFEGGAWHGLVLPRERAPSPIEWTFRHGKVLFRMAKNIYVGNLAWAATADDLLEMFGTFGKVIKAQVITDRDTGRSRGFGFVEMENDEDAQRAIDALNGVDHGSRPLTVNEAKPREDRGPGGSGGPGGGFGGGRPPRGNFGGTDRGRRY